MPKSDYRLMAANCRTHPNSQIWDPEFVDQFMAVFSFIANVITVVAGLIAIAGVIWAVSGRARLSVSSWVGTSPAPDLRMSIASVGPNPIRDLEVSMGSLDDNEFAMWGDGLTQRPALNRSDWLSIATHEAGTSPYGSPPSPGEHRIELDRGDGLFLTFQWRSPLFPWRRPSATYSWPPARRFAGAEPLRLSGRAETAFLARTRDQSLNPTLPGFTLPPWAPPRSRDVTDATFDSLLGSHKGPVLVGFAYSTMGVLRDDARRLMDAAAAKHSRDMLVLFVDIDKCPVLASRFPTSTAPVFKVLRDGKVTGTVEGLRPFADFEGMLPSPPRKRWEPKR